MTTSMKAKSLNGKWRLTGMAPEGAERMELHGVVPGHVHLDLLSNGRIPDPFWRDQAEACQWVEKWDWLYERDFVLDASWVNSWVVLEFGGLDTFAEITVNGQIIGRTVNMFIPHRFEVGALLKVGRNRIGVHFDNIGKHTAGKPGEHECAFGTPERIYVRRMQCTFHWDWVNRFVSCGIWRPVKLIRYDRARISDVSVQTQRIDCPGKIMADSAEVLVKVETERRTVGPVQAHVEIVESGGGEPVWSVIEELQADQTSWCLRLESPRLWWPNGYGKQPLYRCRFKLTAQDGSVLDSRELRFGVRTVEIEQKEDAPGSAEEWQTRALRALHPDTEAGNGDAPGRSFIVRVNDERIFCRGANWVPCDPWPSRVDGTWYERLIGLARDGHINCLRAWGGGIYEPEAFWDRCDRMGILVCQDFQMACARYPQDDPEFWAAISEEIPVAIRMLRNHPSLAWWIGNNENGMDFDWDAPDSWGNKIVEKIMLPALRELDPNRPFFPTSPFGGRRNTCMTIGDVHCSSLPMDPKSLANNLKNYRDGIYNSIGRFNSESVSVGSPNLRSLRRFMSEEDIANPVSPMWYFHTKDNPYNDTRLFDSQRQLAEKLFGRAEDPVQNVSHLEYAQYEWVRLTIEAARRKKWYCGGLLFWMFNDCWPATGWSLVDYYGTPKAGWYAMKRACQPFVVSIEATEDAFRIWVCNDTLAPLKGKMSLRIQPFTGLPHWEHAISVATPANSSVVVAEFLKADLPPLGLDVVLMADMKSGKQSDRAWYYEGLPYQMNPPPVELTVPSNTRKGKGGAFVVQADCYARVVTLEADLDFSDNYFDLLPGEQRRIEWRGKHTEIEPIIIRCWNGRAIVRIG